MSRNSLIVMLRYYEKEIMKYWDLDKPKGKKCRSIKAYKRGKRKIDALFIKYNDTIKQLKNSSRPQFIFNREQGMFIYTT